MLINIQKYLIISMFLVCSFMNTYSHAMEEFDNKTVTLKNVSTSFLLDSNQSKKVYTKESNGGAFQKWEVSKGKHGCTLKNVATGLLLDSNQNEEAYTKEDNGGNYQRWHINQGKNGYTLKNVSTSLFLDSNNNKEVYTGGGNGGNYQNWYISIVN